MSNAISSLNETGRDWQTTTILTNTDFIETDCNSGDKRRLKKTQCTCGEKMLIEYNVKTSCRRDKKRIFYHDDGPDSLWGAIRCRACKEPVNETVAYAEYS